MGSAQPGSGAQTFGFVLRQLRVQAGLSLRELGKRALYDYTRLSRAENGEAHIPADKVRFLDEVLHAGGLLIALQAEAACALGPDSVRGSVADSETVTLELRLPDGGIVHVTMSRRQFTQILATAGLSPVLPLAADPGTAGRLAGALGQPARVDGEVIGYLRQVLAAHYAADKMLGARHLLRPVLAQQQDIGNLGAAAAWTRQAAEWAQCAGDTQLAAYMLVRQSNIACLTDDHGAVVQLAAAARRMPRPADPRLTALASQQQARGHALLGEFGTCFSLLDEAAGILTGHSGAADPDVPVYLHHYDLAVLEEQTAACYRAAGRADTAVTILENKISATPANLTRDRGHLTAKLAVTVVQTGHPDPSRAAQLGLTAIDAAHRTGSARIIRELNTLDNELARRWPDRAETKTFHEALTRGAAPAQARQEGPNRGKSPMVAVRGCRCS